MDSVQIGGRELFPLDQILKETGLGRSNFLNAARKNGIITKKLGGRIWIEAEGWRKFVNKFWIEDNGDKTDE